MSISSPAVAILPRGHAHAAAWQQAMAGGLARHGIGQTAPGAADVLIVWGWTQQGSIQPQLARGGHVLVMEVGYLPGELGDRLAWCSLGWDGLNGRARFPRARDGGARWRRHHGDRLQPWNGGGPNALLLGQVPGDAALAGLDFWAWARDASAALARMDWHVRFRAHPQAAQLGVCPPAAVPAAGSLAEALAETALAVTYNSGSAVEAVLAGVPTLALDRGSMAWAVTGHRLLAPCDPLPTPRRAAWAHDLAWCQWTLEEVASGEAWAAVAPLWTELAAA